MMAKTDEERGEILAKTIENDIANTIAESRQENMISIENQFKKSSAELATKHDISDVKKENGDIKNEAYDTKRDISEIRKDIAIIQGEIYEIKKEIKAIDAKIAAIEMKIMELEIRMTNKLYIVIGGLAVFLTTVILGVLPYVLKAS